MRLLLLFWIFLLVFPVSEALAQSKDGARLEPVRLLQIVEPETLPARAVGHFRARIADGAGQPVNYLWDLGDGTLSIGALVSHAYSAPGTYAVSVVARNAISADTLRTQIRVAPAPSAPDTVVAAPIEETESAEAVEKASPSSGRRGLTVPRTALFGSGGLSLEKGGYTWVLATDLWAERAQDRMRIYRLQGYRADIYIDTTGRGSPAHRIVVGQFATAGQARAARPWLPDAAANVWLLELTSPVTATKQQ